MGLGNVAILVGSGILGSVLVGGDAKLPSAGEVLSGAAKFVKKHGNEGKDTSSNTDAHTAQLLSQVNHLRQEIQSLGSRPVTVVTNAARSGPGTFTITVVAVAGAVGYAYIKWKVTVIHGDLSAFQEDLQSVNLVVRSLVSSLPQSTALPVLPTTTPAAEPSPRAEAPQEEQWGFVSRTSSCREGSGRFQEQRSVVTRTSSIREGSPESSNGASSSTGASTGTNTSTSRFGGLRLPGLGFLASSTR
ncbi:Os01g0112300 [Oryza sativa Japonica Group]|uniref:Os01g0112300 protein n=1 Tax=Oryza sativa subsp. japonica TaxID=39947 RepID=Q0JRA2_ORYSJ|nr:Os01g0112300 [Oryza sativa Japonica Group]|eukprot:NP_001041812.2 Os01g0112300 [Oryza sativa Japonica Group]